MVAVPSAQEDTTAPSSLSLDGDKQQHLPGLFPRCPHHGSPKHGHGAFSKKVFLKAGMQSPHRPGFGTCLHHFPAERCWTSSLASPAQRLRRAITGLTRGQASAWGHSYCQVAVPTLPQAPRDKHRNHVANALYPGLCPRELFHGNLLSSPGVGSQGGSSSPWGAKQSISSLVSSLTAGFTHHD